MKRVATVVARGPARGLACGGKLVKNTKLKPVTGQELPQAAVVRCCIGRRKSQAPHIVRRCASANGKTVAWCLSKLRYKGAGGEELDYEASDLRHDLQLGRLQLDVASGAACKKQPKKQDMIS